MLTHNLAWKCLDHCPAGIMVLDHELNIKLWNNWLVRASGIATTVAQGKNLHKVIPHLQNSHILDAIMLALNTGLPSVLTPKLNKFPLPLHRTRADGSKHNFPQNIHILAIRAEEDAERYCLVQINDVSSAFQREHRLRRQAEELEEQKEKLTNAWQEAKRANEAKNMFLANVSHEIRTPLNAIIGLSHLCRQDAAGSVQDDLEKIEQSGKLLLTLVNDILDFAKIDAGKMKLDKRCCEIDRVVAQLADLFKDLAATKGIRLIFDLDDHVPLHIKTDDLRLQQILINLISNAIKFTDSGEVRLHMLWHEPQEHSSMGDLEIQVQDTGIGMSSAELERLFQPFSQADDSTSRKYGGTGLGLAITKRLVNMFKGSITVTSNKNHGSCFSISLPVLSCSKDGGSAPLQLQNMQVCHVGLDQHQLHTLNRALKPWDVKAADCSKKPTNLGNYAILVCPASATASLPPQLKDIPRLELGHAQGAGVQEQECVLAEPVVALQIRRHIQRILQSGAKPSSPVHSDDVAQPLGEFTIMVVEDNAINRTISQKILERMGATIILAEDGEKALERIEEHGEVDAILMDIQMPGMDGYDTCRTLRREPYSYAGPIIALTAHAMSDEPQRCKAAGMDDHVAKPFEPQHIQEVLLGHLRSRQNRAALKTPTAHSNTSSPAPELIWNPEQGLTRISHDLELFSLLVEHFQHQFCLKETEWSQLLQQHRTVQSSWMHNLKGVAANLGASPIAQSAEKLEQQLCAEVPPPSEVQEYKRLRRLLISCCAAMQGWKKEQEQEAPETHAGQEPNPEIVAELFRQLLPLLSNHDLAALDIWEPFHAANHKTAPEICSRINTLVKNLEFGQAKREIHQWLRQQRENVE